MYIIRSLFILIFLIFPVFLFAQENNEGSNEGNEGGAQLHGNFQFDGQIYQKDSSIGASEIPKEKMLMNSYANFVYTQGKFTAGVRFEGYLNTLQGFQNDNNMNDGVGIPYRYATYKNDEMEITAGNFYEQFGSGLILRAYEEKGLGYDNAMDGVRLKYEPVKGVYLKGLVGLQRLYFEKGPGIVRGADGEVNLNEAIPSLSEMKTQISFGGGVVSKFQEDDNIIYKLPENVLAFSGRFNVTHGKITTSGEYAYKYNDPSFDNNFIYKHGEALLINSSYSTKGFGCILSAKRIDNMSYRSDRTQKLNNLSINYLPAINKSFTYTLLNMYPYASQSMGELGASAEIMYKLKKETMLGGKYGTDINMNFTYVHALHKFEINDTIPIGQTGTLGYHTDWFDAGKEMLYQDFNIEFTRKLSDKMKTTVLYQNLIYNNDVLHGVDYHGKIFANTGLIDFTYKMTSNKAIRGEIEGLFTKQDQGNWAMGLVEVTVPRWFFTVQDMYNYGNEESSKRLHYMNVSFGYIKKGTRIQIGYGKQKKGVMCVGGVCRTVPASNGLTISISSTF
ncbi:MAG: hypothetical protein A2275_09825 [Bacteroidetes bacterium RIFOXYA12_FULL_35_11]|nr:MAG: hypothetical protein A2X01_11860 [Bacteroidetes bacterium GWF2_35_48]OFY74647.1 MAG: hypothetical protein A2275_09825 [Bacteroidetes bacterium RIFOXYA12_FULL_35_11]HBX52563.1 hypothetical protein [Bacteroidales bacterium]